MRLTNNFQFLDLSAQWSNLNTFVLLYKLLDDQLVHNQYPKIQYQPKSRFHLDDNIPMDHLHHPVIQAIQVNLYLHAANTKNLVITINNLARVSSYFPACANKVIMKTESRTKSSFSKFFLAFIVRKNQQAYFFQNVWVSTATFIKYSFF